MGTLPLPNDEWLRTQAALEKNNWCIAAAARDMGKAESTIRSRIYSARATKKSPPGSPLDGFNVTGVSTLFNSEGEVTSTWLKENKDSVRQEQMLRETIAAFVEAIKPAKPIPTPKPKNADLCVAYCIGDAHIGLYSWGEETGVDFDLKIARRDIISAVDRLVASAPPADEAIIVQLGDFYHMDDSRFVTPRGNNQLDVDSRFAKVIRVGIEVMRYTIDRALEKHKIVRVRNVAGNHDPHSMITLVEALRGYYSKEKRVIIEGSPKPFFTYRFGSNLIGITHGHTVKTEKLPGVLAVEAQQDWGECNFKYIWHGHIHTRKVFEDMGVLVESFRTLAGRDAWHTEMGYRSGREMQAVVLHKEFGEVERHVAGVRRIRS